MNNFKNKDSHDIENDKLMLFCDKTHFPNLQQTSELIQIHATDAIHMASSDTSIQVVFSWFDKTCSVGRWFGLPGSDLDARCIVIKGSETQKQVFYDRLMYYLDVEIIDKQATSKNMVMLYHDIVAYGNNHYLYAKSVSTQTLQAAHVLSILYDKQLLIDYVSPEEKVVLLWLDLYKKEHNGYIQSHLHLKNSLLKHKRLKRVELQKQFPTLSAHEQYIITKIMQSFCHNIPFNLNVGSENAHIDTLFTLLSKGLLSYNSEKKIFVADRLPTGMHNIQIGDSSINILDTLIS